MSKKKDVHVVPSKEDKNWKVKEGGRVVKETKTKKEAEDAGRKRAKQNESELTIHKKDRKIEKKDSYGNDPCPPKDKD